MCNASNVQTIINLTVQVLTSCDMIQDAQSLQNPSHAFKHGEGANRQHDCAGLLQMGAGAKRQDPPGMEGVYNSSLPGTSEGDRLIQGASSLMLTPTPGSPTRPGTALARRPTTARPQTATTARSACTGTLYSWQRSVQLRISLSMTRPHVTAHQGVVQWSVATAQQNGVALMSPDAIPARWKATISKLPSPRVAAVGLQCRESA